MDNSKCLPECYGEYYTQPIEVCNNCSIDMSCFIETEAHNHEEEE